MGNQATKEYSKYHRHAGSKKNVHWEEAERPHPPGQPLLVPASPGAQNDVVTIRWDPPISDGGAAITGYLVEHRRTGSPHWVRATPGVVSRCQLTLSGLEPGWRYQFRVSAENGAGRSDPSAVSEPLTVTLAKGVATAPHFSKELQDTVALENEKVELTVRVTGTPAPKISWFKDGLEVFSGRRSRVVTDGEGTVITSTLVIHQAALADEGEIKCAATNRAGHAVSKARLRLEAPPSIRLPRQYEDGLLFELGEVIRVKVSVAGRPAPRVSWLHNGEVLRPGPRHELLTNDKGASLRVSEARRSDRGEYQVRAVNQLGEDVAAFLVTVTDHPTPPGKAMVAMTLGRSVTLTWGPPDDDGGCKIGNYIVEYYRFMSGPLAYTLRSQIGWDMWLKAATCRQLNTTLGDLIEGSEYKFRVKAENPYGISDPGDESETIFIPDPKRGISDPPQRTVDGSEKGADWWPERKRPREGDDDAQDEKKARADDSGGGGGTPTRKRPPPLSMELEDVSPIPSPVPRASRPPEKTLSLTRTRSAAPGAGSPRREDAQTPGGAPEPPKRRNRSVPRRGDSVSPEPDSLGSYLPTTPDEMGVVKGRLYGIHLSTDSVRARMGHGGGGGGIEEVIYPPLPSPAASPSPRHSPRRSPIGGGEVVTKPEANGVLDLRQVEEYANKYEAKLMELERRQRELEERGRQRQLELEQEQKKEMERMRRERDREREERERDRERERERERDRAREREKDIGQAGRRKSETAAVAERKHDGESIRGAAVQGHSQGQGQDRLFPRSEDGSMAGDSSEFLLVLLPNSRATTEERGNCEEDGARSADAAAALRRSVEGDGEASVAPPMSLSAPELGAIDPDVPFMRNAVSSTELLHERAMARFYQEVAEEEAEKARRRRLSIERRVSLERRLSIERKNRERLKGRMDSVDEDAEEEIPVNFKRFAAARPSDGSATQPAPDALPAPATRVTTSEEREQAEFAALRERLNRVAKDGAEDARAMRRTRSEEEEDLEDYLEDEELEEEEDEEDELGEEEEEEDEDSEGLEEDDDLPLEQPEEEPEEETYHPRFGGRAFSPADDTPPTPPPHRKASEPELFIPKAETYTTMTEHDNVASVLLTKRHSPVKGDVKPKPILKKRGSMRRNSKSPGSKSPRSKSPGPLSPLLKVKDKLRYGERRKSTDSQDSDKSEKRLAGKLFKPIQREEDSDPDASPPVKLRAKPDRTPVADHGGDPRVQSGLTVSPEADLGISAAEAARNKRGLGAPRKDSLKDEATKVVISHYSELVRTYGSANKAQQPKYLTYDELRARAESANGSAEDVGPAEPQQAVLSKPEPTPEPVPVRPFPADTPVASPAPSLAPEPLPPPEPPVAPVTSSSVREDLLARRESRRDPSATRRDSTSRRETSAARREASSARREPSVPKRDPSVSSSRRREPSASKAREPSVSRRDASLSKRDASVSRRDGSATRRRDGSVSRRDGSVSRRDGSALRAGPGLGRDRTYSDRSSVHRSHTSVASSTLSDDLRPRTSEEELALARRAEQSVKSTISYVTDLGMLVLAVWLFLFSSELLALPVLALLVYRQVKEEVRRRTPAWLVRFAARLRALGQGKPKTVAPAAGASL
ncbi:Titin [Frankliniella fusca]|uniref:Titin n=1 Tax=Frankliniella fusca TaxID=407009 RepID=A0AAE1HIE9_9NEOP|nr:Titin [Frankliniella fusca]